MGLFDNFKKTDVWSLENPNAPVSADGFLYIMGWGDVVFSLILMACRLRAPDKVHWSYLRMSAG